MSATQAIPIFTTIHRELCIVKSRRRSCTNGVIFAAPRPYRRAPDFETRGNEVTLRHLPNHTSGIAELGGMQELRAIQLMRNPTATRDDVYKVIN